MVLLHESLHYNKTGPPYGGRIAEGITESATRDLAVRYGLHSSDDIRRSTSYATDRKGVDYLLEEIIKRSPMDRAAALDILLEAYLTGRPDKPAAIFGADAWQRVLALGHSEFEWNKNRILVALKR